MNRIDPQSWKAELPAFREKAEAYARGEVKKPEYKGFSGRYGSYAQRDPSKNMLRLRMPGGRVTAEKLAFVAKSIRQHDIKKLHFTTCQTIQLHDLNVEATCSIMEGALDVGIVTLGGGGDYPRNVMCSPLSGVEKDEYFDVLPYAEIAGQYTMNFINAEKMPRKLKIGFSNSPANITHATYRDLGFAARPDGKFDVYSAGGLGNHPKFGVKVAEAIEPDQILYYVKAMWVTFCTYGNYKNRGRARTRYMQETLGGADAYKKAYLEKLEDVRASGEDLTIQADARSVTKSGDGTAVSGPRVLEQKQPGLYTVVWHPIGGSPAPEEFCALSDAVAGMEAVELRLDPDETAYIINLTGSEAETVLELTKNSAQSLFETSVSCIGASICQVGLRDSQSTLRTCVEAVRNAQIPDGALPRIHISGCPSSCGTHQTGDIGFRGAAVKGKPAFLLFVGGCSLEGKEAMGTEVGTVLEENVPAFLVRLGQTVASSGLSYAAWNQSNPGALEQIAADYLVSK